MKKLYILTAISLILSCSEKKETATENTTVESNDMVITDKQFQSSNMALGSIKTHDFFEYVKANGMLDVPPQNKAEVSAYYGGYVKSLNLLPGQWVNAGQVLFTLENPEFIEAQQDYLEAKSQLDYLRQDYERQKILSAEEIVSKKKYQRSKADYDLVRNQVNVLKRRLQMMKINPNAVSGNNLRSTIAVTSPISGYVTEVYASKGEFLSPQDVAIAISNTSTMHLELNVFEKDLIKIANGMPVEFRLQENPEEWYDAEIHLISQAIDPETRTANVHCDVVQPDGTHFSTGMYAEAKIKTESNPKPALPKEAVLALDDENYVLVKKSNQNGESSFEKVKVETGLEDEEFVEIKTPISPNAEIIIQGGFQLVQ